MDLWNWPQQILLTLQRDIPLLDNIYAILGIVVIISTFTLGIRTGFIKLVKTAKKHLSKRKAQQLQDAVDKRQDTPSQTENESEQQTQSPVQKSELRVTTGNPCPKTGPYRMFEHKDIIRSFNEGEIMPLNFGGMFPHAVTWIYIPPQHTNEAQPPQAKIETVPINKREFNEQMLRTLGYVYSNDIINHVLDDAILNRHNHSVVQSRLINIISAKDDLLDKAQQAYGGPAITSIDMSMTREEKEQIYRKGFEAGITDYLKTLSNYLSLH